MSIIKNIGDNYFPKYTFINTNSLIIKKLKKNLTNL